MKKLFSILLVLALCLGMAIESHATLIDRGTGMIYDTDLGITWLQDANYAQTSGYEDDGRMSWYQANTWAENLNYGGYSDWRLPHTLPVDGTSLPADYGFGTYSAPYYGAEDRGYNVSAPGSMYPSSTGSEMAYMYYNSLGNLAYADVSGNYPQPGWGLQNTGPFVNLNLQGTYWSGTEYTDGQGDIYVWRFSFYEGFQETYSPLGNVRAWAVRDGDTGPSVSEASPYVTTMLLGNTFSFDYWWEMGQEPEGYNLDILFFRDGRWQFLGWELNFDGSSTGWQTAYFSVPHELWGVETQLRFAVLDLGDSTDPTAYLRNISSSGQPPSPNPPPCSFSLQDWWGLQG